MQDQIVGLETINLDASITNIDIANYKINLSIRVMEEQIEKEAMEKYGSKDSGASLGAILGKALGQRQKRRLNILYNQSFTIKSNVI